jgi:hypothetical protein
MYSNWYILYVLCRLAASRVGPNLLAASQHNMYKIVHLVGTIILNIFSYLILQT